MSCHENRPAEPGHPADRASSSELQKKLRIAEDQVRALRATTLDMERERAEAAHRSLNTLQLAISFVRLEQKKIAEPSVRALLDGTVVRLEAVARLQRQLGRKSGADRIDLEIYLGGLATDLSVAFGLDCVASSEPLTIDVSTAADIALILNELVTNAAKHAYGGGPGIIEIDARAEGGALRLAVRDFGPGLAGQPGSEGSLGMRIVKSLVQQRGATLALANDNGLSVTMRFPLAGSPNR